MYSTCCRSFRHPLLSLVHHLLFFRSPTIVLFLSPSGCYFFPKFSSLFIFLSSVWLPPPRARALSLFHLCVVLGFTFQFYLFSIFLFCHLTESPNPPPPLAWNEYTLPSLLYPGIVGMVYGPSGYGAAWQDDFAPLPFSLPAVRAADASWLSTISSETLRNKRSCFLHLFSKNPAPFPSPPPCHSGSVVGYDVGPCVKHISLNLVLLFLRFFFLYQSAELFVFVVFLLSRQNLYNNEIAVSYVPVSPPHVLVLYALLSSLSLFLLCYFFFDDDDVMSRVPFPRPMLVIMLFGSVCGVIFLSGTWFYNRALDWRFSRCFGFISPRPRG